MADARVTALDVEVVSVPDGDARVTALEVEVVASLNEYFNLVKIGLSDANDPEVDTEHVLRVRMRKILDEYSGSVRVRLVQAPDTVISTFEEDL